MTSSAGPQSDDALLAELARSVVRDVAPRELPLFPAASAAYFRDPSAVTRRRVADDPLGFGGELGSLLTPVVLSVLGQVLTMIWAEVSAGVREAGRDAVKERVKALFARTGGGAPAGAAGAAQPLSAEQRARVRAQTLAAASALLPAAQAALLADVIDAKLA